jgi:UDP-glucose-4-epimerase GalE
LGADRGTVLVTGGAGYIGSHTAKRLAAGGRRLVVYDNLSTGVKEAVRWSDLVVGDVHDEDRLRDTLRRYAVSSVMHFAASTSVGESVAKPLAYYRNNVEGTLTLLRALVAESVFLLVFSSTAAVYGNPEQTPITESHPMRPINAYGETKAAVERALCHVGRAHGLRSVTLRYFNAAGADPDGEIGENHDPETHVIPLAVEAALGGETLRVFGGDYATPDGTCLRDYIHVSDLAEAHGLALDWLEAGGASRVYNLGNGTPFSVRQIIESVERVGGRAVPWTLAPRRPGDPDVLFASSGAIRDELGWGAGMTDLDRIVATAWAWRQAHRSGNPSREQA